MSAVAIRHSSSTRDAIVSTFTTGQLSFLNMANTAFGGLHFNDDELLARLQWFRQVADRTPDGGVIFVPGSLREGAPLLIKKHREDRFSI